MRRLKVVTLAAGIGQAFLVFLVSRMRFRDDFPVHGKLLPFPPAVVVHVKTPNEIHGWFCHRFDKLIMVVGIANDTGLGKNIVDLLLPDPLVYEVFQFRAECIAG